MDWTDESLDFYTLSRHYNSNIYADETELVDGELVDSELVVEW